MHACMFTHTHTHTHFPVPVSVSLFLCASLCLSESLWHLVSQQINHQFYTVAVICIKIKPRNTLCFAGRSWQDCSHPQVVQPISMAKTSKPPPMKSDSLWACVPSTTSSLTCKCTRASVCCLSVMVRFCRCRNWGFLSWEPGAIGQSVFQVSV